MSNCKIQFQYNQNDIEIQCFRHEMIRDIVQRYGEKSELKVENFYFLYGGDRVDLNQKLSELNNKDSIITFLVYSISNTEHSKKMVQSNVIKCVQCNDPAIIEFSNDYGLGLIDTKHGKKIINLKDYNDTQLVDQNKIICSKCSKNISEISQASMYYCFECKKNFCLICKCKHNEHKNIVDFSKRYFRCSEHKDKDFISYCLKCKKNLCIFCANQHKSHQPIQFENLMPKPGQSEDFNEKIKKAQKLVNDIIDSLKKFNENLNVYVNINDKLNENLSNMVLNYENLISIKNLVETSIIKKDIEDILNENDINKRFKKIISIYNMMNKKSSDIINTDYDDIEVDEIQIPTNKSTNFNFNNKNKNKNKKANNFNSIYSNKKSANINNFDYDDLLTPDVQIPTNNKPSNINCNININKSTTFNFTSTNKNSTNINNSENDNHLMSGFQIHNTSKSTNFNNNNFDDDDEIPEIQTENNTTNVYNFNYNDVQVTEVKSKKSYEKLNEIKINIKIEQNEVDNIIYFLDNSNINGDYWEDYIKVKHNHDNLMEINENNTTLLINGQTMPFKKYFIPKICGVYTIKLIFKNKITNCAYMFCECNNIIDIDFSKFNTQDVTDMKYMFFYCHSLTTLNLSSFNTENLKDTQRMFSGCSGLKSLNLKNFNTKNVTNMFSMFSGCSSLTTLDLSSFNTENVTTMFQMFGGCKSLSKLDLRSFNANKASTVNMFLGCWCLSSCWSYDQKILDSFNKK